MKKLILSAVIACTPFTAAHSAEVNIRPLGVLFGSVGGNALFTVSEDNNIKAGPSFSYWSVDSGTWNFLATSIGGRLEKSTASSAYENGAFVAVDASYLSITVKDDTSTSCEASGSGTLASGLAGYSWYFTNNFSSKVAAGYSFGSLDLSSQCSYGYTDTASESLKGLALEWTLGYRF